MRYTESSSSIAEIFRLVLQKLTELKISFSPVHYAVMFEYVTGINPPLKEAVEAILSLGRTPSDQEMEQIFISHIVPEFQIQVNHHQTSVAQEVQELLSRLSKSTSTTSQDAAKYQEGLETYKSLLESGKSLDEKTLLQVVRGALKGTLSMKSSMSHLDTQLTESQSEIARLQKELQSARVEAVIDPLSDLLNRRGLEAEVESCVKKDHNSTEPCTILMIDIDHFKLINDTHGHLVGDQVIRAVAKAIKMSVRGEDIAARIGGEEFAVVLPRTNSHQGFIVAEHIRTHVERIELLTTKSRQKIGGITVSIGLDSCAWGQDWKTVLDNADKALYQSKAAGRNRTTVFFRE